MYPEHFSEPVDEHDSCTETCFAQNIHMLLAELETWD